MVELIDSLYLELEECGQGKGYTKGKLEGCVFVQGREDLGRFDAFSELQHLHQINTIS